MGVRDFAQQQDVATVMRTHIIWRNDGICASWFNRRYIKDKPFGSITGKYNDTATCRQLLQQREITRWCIDCNTNGQVIWKGIRVAPKVENVINTLRE